MIGVWPPSGTHSTPPPSISSREPSPGRSSGRVPSSTRTAACRSRTSTPTAGRSHCCEITCADALPDARFAGCCAAGSRGRVRTPGVRDHHAPTLRGTEPDTGCGSIRRRVAAPPRRAVHAVPQVARRAGLPGRDDPPRAGDAHGLNELFGYPGKPVPAVVADSIPGPFRPVRPIGVNGNHRTLALEAIEAPLILCQVHRFKALYRCKFHEDDDWPWTLSFLRWLEARQVLRLSARPIAGEDPWVWLRVADATIPWLAAPPSDALGALRARTKSSTDAPSCASGHSTPRRSTRMAIGPGGSGLTWPSTTACDVRGRTRSRSRPTIRCAACGAASWPR